MAKYRLVDGMARHISHIGSARSFDRLSKKLSIGGYKNYLKMVDFYNLFLYTIKVDLYQSHGGVAKRLNAADCKSAPSGS